MRAFKKGSFLFERGENMATPKLGYGTVEEHGNKVKWTDLDKEIERTKNVLIRRQDQGMDTSAQLSHWKSLTGKDFNPSYVDKAKVQVNDLYDLQRQSQIDALRANQARATADMNAKKKETSQAYYGKKNQADVVNLQNVQRLRETMANMGLGKSGENVTAQVGLANQRQDSLNTLNAQEQSAIDAFNRQLADINNPAREQAIINKLESQRAQALLDLGMQSEQMDYQRGLDTRNFNYQLGRDNVMDNRWQDQFAYQQERDSIGDERWKLEFDEMVKQNGVQNAIAWARENRISSGGGSSGGSSIERQNLNPIIDNLNRNFLQESGEVDEFGNKIDGVPVVNDPNRLFDAILSYGLSGEQTRDLIRYYGLQDVEERRTRLDGGNTGSRIGGATAGWS